MSKMLKNSSSKRSFDPRELRSELRSEVSSDHLVVRATGWTMRHQRIIEMELEWQRLEAALFTKAATREISCAAAMKGKFAEAKRMRALDAEIGVGYRELAFEAGEIQAMKSSSVSVVSTTLRGAPLASKRQLARSVAFASCCSRRRSSSTFSRQ